jgi:putative ABC transport system permease protein
MSGQLSFLKNRDLGFNQNQIVAVSYRGINSQQILDTYRTELKKYNSIINICGAYSFPAGYFHTATARTGNSSLAINQNKIDYEFLETFDIKLVEGRNFSREIASDTTGSIIINKAAVNRMGWQSGIGKKMVIDWMGWEVEVIGVVEDFHYASLYEKIEPLVLFLDPYVPFEYFFIRIKPENISYSLEVLEDKWGEIIADQPFEYFFIDEKFAQFYYSVERWNTIVTYSSILAIFIACVGLFGLTALIMVKRTKEIGIRKVVGASVQSIVLMLSSQFTKWILLANIIAWPTSYYVMDLWLQNFAYKIEMNWWIFIFAGCIGLAVAITVIGFQAIKSALTNPVESLRYE